MVNENRPGVVVLSRNGTSPYEFPADIGDPFPDGATTHCVFTDTLDNPIADIAGAVFPSRIQYMFAHEDVGAVKRGFNFEAFIVIDGVEYMQRYGKVVRREATFEYVSTAVDQTQPVYVSGDFTLAIPGQLGARYAQVWNSAVIIENSGSTPNAMGTDLSQMFDSSAVRIRKAVATDSVRMQVMMVPGGAGKTRVGFCANMPLNNYVGVEFDGTANTVKMCTGTGPLTGPYHGSPASDTIAAGGTFYTLDFNSMTKVFTVTKAGSTTPLMTPWTDSGNLVVHGQGYRYGFFSFNGSVLETGPQVASWEIQDYVGA